MINEKAIKAANFMWSIYPLVILESLLLRLSLTLHATTLHSTSLHFSNKLTDSNCLIWQGKVFFKYCLSLCKGRGSPLKSAVNVIIMRVSSMWQCLCLPSSSSSSSSSSLLLLLLLLLLLQNLKYFMDYWTVPITFIIRIFEFKRRFKSHLLWGFVNPVAGCYVLEQHLDSVHSSFILSLHLKQHHTYSIYWSEMLSYVWFHRGANSFFCDECGLTFKFRTSLQKHKVNRHETEQGPFSCEECGKSFTKRIQLTNHKISTHCVERKFLCQVCSINTKF